MYNKAMENQNKTNLQKICLIFVITILLYFVLSVAVSVMLELSISEGEDLSGYYTKPWYTLLSYGVFPISFIISLLIFSRKEKEILKSIVPNKSFKIVYLPLVLVLAFSILFGLSELNGYFIELLVDNFGYEPPQVYLPKKSFWGIACAVFAIAILPAICEELMFRKLILDSMKNLPTWFTVLTGGLLFSLFHFNPAQTPYQFVFGCVFVMVALVTDSVYFTIIMHFLNNLTILIIYYAGWSATFPLFITIIALIVFALILAFLIYKLARQQEKKESVKNGLFIFVPIILCLVIWFGGLL